MNFVYCCSDLFAEVCVVSVVSLYENNKHVSEPNVYIVDDGIAQYKKDRLEKIAANYERYVSILECDMSDYVSVENNTGKEYDAFYHFAWS